MTLSTLELLPFGPSRLGCGLIPSTLNALFVLAAITLGDAA